MRSSDAAHAAFTAKMNAFRVVCGQPSYGTLERLSGKLRRSTIGDALSGRSRPSLELVVEFVRVCQLHATRIDIVVEPAMADLDEWVRHWRTLHGPPVDTHADKIADASSTNVSHFLVPRQLPADPGPLWGREAQLDHLDAFLRGGLVVVTGMGGVGKSALVARWAHDHRPQFPDGELWVELQPGTGAAQPELVLGSILRSLGLVATSLPSDLADLIGLYRSAVADKKMLVVLDDAANVEQVRSLLPGTARCTTVVTSRGGLPSLSVTHGADRIMLTPLSVDVAVGLLQSTTLPGRSPLTLSSDLARDLSHLCGGLPLALRVVAQRLSWESAESVRTELSQEHRRLSGLALADDPSTSAHTVLSSALDRLDPATRQAILLFTLHPGQTLTMPGIAALTGTSHAEAADAVRALVQGNLLEPCGPTRFRLHDLVRLVATERRNLHVSQSDQRLASRRLLEWFHATAARAARLVAPFLDRPPAPGGAADPSLFAKPDEAWEWLTAQVDDLPHFVEAALAGSYHRIAAWLPIEFAVYTLRALPYPLSLGLLERAETASLHIDEPRVQSLILTHRANILGRLARPAEARSCFLQSLQYDTTLAAAALTRANIARTWLDEGDVTAAEASFKAALEIIEDSGQVREEAVVRVGYAEVALRADKLDFATELAMSALRGFAAIGEPHGQADAETILARVASRSHAHADAIRLATKALKRFEGLGDPAGQAEVCSILAEIYRLAGMPRDGARAQRRAASLMAGLGRVVDHGSLRGTATVLGGQDGER